MRQILNPLWRFKLPETARKNIDGRIRRMTPVSTPADQRQDVVALFRLLDRLARTGTSGARACRIVGPDGESTRIPEAVFCALKRVAELLGGGDAIAAMLQFANPNKWSLMDFSTGEFLDPEKPSQKGWEDFQASRDKLIDQYRNEDKT